MGESRMDSGRTIWLFSSIAPTRTFVEFFIFENYNLSIANSKKQEKIWLVLGTKNSLSVFISNKQNMFLKYFVKNQTQYPQKNQQQPPSKLASHINQLK